MEKILAEKLANINKNLSAVIGFDGFIDEIVHVVDKRIDFKNFTRVETLKEYGEKIKKASGLSINVEIFPLKRKLGGNGPIFALALKGLGLSISYIGATGLNHTDEVFLELEQDSVIIGIEEPAQTDAMEFLDGKIIRSKSAPLNRITWDKITNKISVLKLAELFDSADLLSFNNWTMITHMSSIWRNIIDCVIPQMQSVFLKKTMFFDLADPEKRNPEDILNALKLIGEFAKIGFNVVLGLNKKEACEIYELLYNEKINDYASFDLADLCTQVYSKLSVNCLVVHPVDRAACVTRDGYFEAKGPYCEKPVLTTGAGDNFNAGFILGYLNGFELTECLKTGTASSGFYVRNARSAKTKELSDFLSEIESLDV